MKVKCINIFNEIKKEYQVKSTSMTIDKEYTVFEVLISPEKKILYRLVRDNDNTPALFNADQFEILTNKIPANWGIFPLLNGAIIFTPNSWADSSFWDAFYDGKIEAIKTYRREAIFILKEDGVLPASYQDNEEELFRNNKDSRIINLSVKK